MAGGRSQKWENLLNVIILWSAHDSSRSNKSYNRSEVCIIKRYDIKLCHLGSFIVV